MSKANLEITVTPTEFEMNLSGGVLSGGTQRRTLSQHQSEEIEI